MTFALALDRLVRDGPIADTPEPDTMPFDPGLRQSADLPSAVELINALSLALGIPWDQVIRRALVLYSLAVEADGDGNRLAVLSPDDEIVREVVGLRP